MDATQKSLHAAWDKLLPQLDQNPAELRRRLARRDQKLIASPPRAWCLAVRATDKRLDRYATSSPVHPSSFCLHPSTLLLDPLALHSLTRLIDIPSPGLAVRDLARILGTSPHNLLDARLNKTFRTHYVPARGGRREAILYYDHPLDPAARGFVPCDPIWSATARDARPLPDLPPQTLTRVPVFYDATKAYADKSHLHPEHPANDPIAIKKSRSQKLPPPEPDYIPYKWKGDQYVGYDWKRAETNPRIKENYERHQRQLEMSRKAAKRRRQENPPPSKAKGSQQFRGYRFLCPTCGRKVNLLYLPLPRLHLLLPLPSGERAGVRGDAPDQDHAPDRAAARFDRLLKRVDKTSAHARPTPTFACDKCHKIKRQSPADPNYWNELVTYLSGGLLYGHEVPRPDSIPQARRANRAVPDSPSISNPPSQIPARKIPYKPRPNRSPSARRPQIQSLLLAGRSFTQIARQLGLVRGTILWHAQQVYKQNGVRTLVELLQKFHRPELAEGLRGNHCEEIRRRLLAGQDIPTIAAELRVKRMVIYNVKQVMKKKGIDLPDGLVQYYSRRKRSQAPA